MEYTAQETNSALVDKITNQGLVKEAEVSISAFTRDRLREDSIVANKILTEQFITDADLDKSTNLDEIRKIVELEPDSTAAWVSFRGLNPSRYLSNQSAVCPFALVSSEKMVKSIYELKTRSNDIRKIVSDNQVKDIAAQQDGKFFETARQIATDFGYVETLNGGLTKTNFVEATKRLPARKIPNGCAVMNESTAREILKWDTNDVGFQPVSDMFAKGLYMTEIEGIKIITTIKNEVVLDNEMFFFGQEDFLGKFYTLEDVTVWVDSKQWFIEFMAYKVLGMIISNVKAVQKFILNP